MQKVIATIVVLIAASAGWHYRDVLIGWSRPVPAPKPFVFDNGTARRYEPESRLPEPSKPNGTVRKCVRGTDVAYTDMRCQAGYSERPIDTSRMTVISFSDDARLASDPPAATPRKTLRDVLDLGRDDRLRERVIERAVAAGSR